MVDSFRNNSIWANDQLLEWKCRNILSTYISSKWCLIFFPLYTECFSYNYTEAKFILVIDNRRGTYQLIRRIKNLSFLKMIFYIGRPQSIIVSIWIFDVRNSSWKDASGGLPFTGCCRFCATSYVHASGSIIVSMTFSSEIFYNLGSVLLCGAINNL